VGITTAFSKSTSTYGMKIGQVGKWTLDSRVENIVGTGQIWVEILIFEIVQI
jgi:hypothetical protein